jgi:hypothetical protein
MAFRDLGEVLDAGLSLPYKGKTYVIPPADAETGLRFQRLAEVAAQAAQDAEAGDELDAELLDDAGEVDLYRDALGPAYDAMISDRVPWPMLKVAAVTEARRPLRSGSSFWMAATLNDPPMTAALRVMHADPARQWTVATLAVKAGVAGARSGRRGTRAYDPCEGQVDDVVGQRPC